MIRRIAQWATRSPALSIPAGLIGLFLLIYLAVGTRRFLENHQAQELERARERVEETNRLIAAHIAESNRQVELAAKEAAERKATALAEAKRIADEKQAAFDKKLAEETAAKEAALAIERAAQEKRDHIAGSLRSSNTLKQPGRISLAIAVGDGSFGLDESYCTTLGRSLTNAQLFVGQPFTQAFAAGGGLLKILKSDKEEFATLGLSNLVDYILVGRYHIRFTTNPDLGNLITASLHLDASIVRTTDTVIVETFELDTTGADFTNERAQATAKNRLLQPFASREWEFLKK